MNDQAQRRGKARPANAPVGRSSAGGFSRFRRSGRRFPLAILATLLSFSVGISTTSSASPLVSPRVATVPTAPIDLLASGGNGSATLTWSAPTSNGGAAITSYVATALPGSKSCTTTTLTCTITGLTNGSIYTFNVVAKNSVGTSPGSNPLVGTGTSASYAASILSTGLNFPQCAVVDAAGNLDVADFYNSRILSFSGTGAPKELATPYGPGCVAVDNSGNLFVDDYSGFLKRFAAGGGETTLLSGVVPGSSGLTLDALGNIYVAGVGPTHSNVVKLTPSGAGYTQSTIGSGFSDPNGLALDAQGNLYVGDGGVVDPTGTAAADSFIYKVTPGGVQTKIYDLGPGGGAGQLAFDASNNLWIADPGNNRLVEISPSGVVSTSDFGGIFGAIYGVAFDGAGNMFLIDSFQSNGDAANRGAIYQATVTTPRPTVPGTPQSVAAVKANASATLTWVTPSSGGSPITGYVVTPYVGATPQTPQSFGANATGGTVTGLTNGQTYTFTVAAQNANGQSPDSAATAPVTPSTTPQAPTLVTAAKANASAVLSWQAPDNGGASITGYVVTPYVGATPQATQSFGPNATNGTVTGLTNGQTYTFTVAAQNLNGIGIASSASNAVTPSGVAKAPTGITATPGASSVTVSWVAPDAGGSPITGYRVTPTTGGVAGTPRPFLSTATSGTVTGLTNGLVYTFVVVAVNANGLGTPSVPSLPVTPSTVPNAPSVVSLTRGNQSALVTWSIPGSGGSPLTGYTVTSSPDGFTCATSGATSCLVTGLSNGTSYTFTVVATNANGSGAASDPSSAVTPLQVPGPPLNVSPTHLDGSVQVSWSPPLDDGGSPIVLTTVTALLGNTPAGSCFSSDVASCTVQGLTNGATYSFVVVASNSTGDGLPAPASSATPSRVADSPFSIAAVSGNSSVMVSWSAPASNGGTALTGYLVTASPGGATCSTNGATFCTVDGLTNGVAYTFSVVAINANGPSSPSAASDATTPADVPSVPLNIGLVATAGAVVVTWSTPLSDGGSPILSVSAIAALNGTDVASCSSTSGLTCTIDGLTNGLTYSIRLKAANLVGDSATSVPLTVMPSTTPGPAFGLAATKADGRATLRWFGATDSGGLPITGYRVTASPGGATCQTSGALACTVTGLTNGQSYTFVVVALNANGSGVVSAPSVAVTPSTTPGAPTGVSAALGSNRITVTWSAPLSSGGAAVSGYLLTASPGGRTCQTTSALSCAMTGLTNGVSYTFSVVAINRNGSSSASLPSAPVIASPPPGAPVSPTAVRANSSAIVSWSAPVPNGGLAVTGYLVAAVPGGATCTTTGALTCTVVGLVNGTSYAFTVVASNPAGLGPESAPTALVTPSSVPGAPARPRATRGNTSATVTWDPPIEAGGGAISGYLVTPLVNGVPQTPRQFGSSITSITLGGLPNGQPVTFTVAAINLNGAGPPSEASVAVIPARAPGAPTSVLVTMSAGNQATVSWLVPDNGGSPVTSGIATAIPSGRSCTSTGTSCTINGLTSGTAYRFTVTATNEVGSSPASAASPSALPVVADVAGQTSMGVVGNSLLVTSPADQLVLGFTKATGVATSVTSLACTPGAAESDGSALWVACPRAGTVTAIGADGSILKVVTVGGTPSLLSISGGSLLVATKGGATIAVVSRATGSVRRVGTGVPIVGLVPYGAFVWVLTGAGGGEVIRFQVATGAHLRPVVVKGGLVSGVVIGSVLNVAVSSTRSVTRLNALTGASIGTLLLGVTPRQLLSAGSSLLVVTTREVLLFAPGARSVTKHLIGLPSVGATARDGLNIWVSDLASGAIREVSAR